MGFKENRTDVKDGKKVIFQRFSRNSGETCFPYPLLYREPGADYICFTDDARVHSSTWKMQVVEDLTKADLEPYLEKYAVRWELKANQVQLGSLAGEAGCGNVVTVPKLEELPFVKFDPQKLVPTADAEGNYIYRRNSVYTDGKYNGRPLLLTIGVPVSNQISTIDRCLSHIRPLLDGLDAELLVVDTGSTDGTVEICRKYGARVITRPWDGNMSAARNEAVYQAKGEWYLSIDNDEWFEDVVEILRFFKEGFYRKYDRASYIQRNYMNSDGTVYEDNHTLRMARITPGLHFEGRIHDALVTDAGLDEIFVLHSYAHHYGFVGDNPEKVRRKVMRNVPVLLQDVYEYPKNLRYLFQLANEYRNICCTETAIGLFAQTMAMAKEADDPYRGKNAFVMLCACLLDTNDRRLFWWAQNLERKFPLTVPEQAFLAWSREMLAFRIKEAPEQILHYYERYEELLRQYRRNPGSGQFQTYYGLSAVEHELYIIDARAAAFVSYLSKEEKGERAENAEEKALEILNHFSVEKITDERIHFAVLKEGLAAGDGVYEAVCGKITAIQWEEWSKDILDAFAEGIAENSVYRRQLERLPGLLARMSVPAIQFWLEHSGGKREGEIAERFLAYAMNCEAEGETVQELCFCSRILKEEYVRKREMKNGREIFHHYLAVLAAFAERYYHQELLTDPGCHVIPSDIRAAYRMAAVLADGKPSHENVELLKQAPAIFPAFHEEIRGILMKLSTNG